MSDLHFPEREVSAASDSANLPDVCGEPLIGGYCTRQFSHDGEHEGRIALIKGPGRWVSDREMDAYFASHAGEIRRLEKRLEDAPYKEAYFAAALSEIIAVLGPEVCDCDAHDCGLREEVREALTVARLALDGELCGVLNEQWSYITPYGDHDENHLPGTHTLDLTFDTREQAEADADQWASARAAVGDDARYMVLRRHVTHWEVAP